MFNLIKLIKYIALHAFTFLMVIVPLYAVTITLPLIFPPRELFDLILLYGSAICLLLLPIQTGLQLDALIRFDLPPFLLSYYFQYDVDKKLPHEVLEPVKSRLGVLVLILLLAGGYVAWPFFIVYGFILVYMKFIQYEFYKPENIMILVDKLSRLFPSLLMALFLFIVFSVFAIQRRARSR